MDFETKIREALSHAPVEQPKSFEGFDVLERRARRDTAKRAVASVLALALLTGGSVLGASRLMGSGTPEGFAGDPEGAPFVDQRIGYRASVPDGWGARSFGDEVRFSPSEDGPTPDPRKGSRGPLPIVVSIRPEPRVFEDWVAYQRAELARQEALGLVVQERTTRIGGRPAVRWEASLPDGIEVDDELAVDPGSHSVHYYVDWQNGWMLDVSISSFAEELFRNYEKAATSLAESLRVSTGSEKALGTFAPSIVMDDIAAGLRRFLDAQVIGDGAEEFLSDLAAEDFADPRLDPELYRQPYVRADGPTTSSSSGATTTGCVGCGEENQTSYKDYVGYRVLERAGDAFNVAMIADDGEPFTSTYGVGLLLGRDKDRAGGIVIERANRGSYDLRQFQPEEETPHSDGL